MPENTVFDPHPSKYQIIKITYPECGNKIHTSKFNNFAIIVYKGVITLRAITCTSGLPLNFEISELSKCLPVTFYNN